MTDASAVRTAYLARWVLPISAPSIPDGALIVQNGRIAYVGAADALRNGTISADRIVDFGAACILPGLVNVHSHLELTALRGMLEGLDFGTWLRLLTAARTELLSDEDLYLASIAGIREGLLAGVTTFADATASGAPMRALVDSGVRGTAYLEVFGPDVAQRDGAMVTLRDGVDRLGALATSRVRVGVSPHAPYTVSAPLFSAVARLAREASLPVSVHVAESAAEVEFVRHGTGGFADRLQARGITVSARFRSPIALLESTGVLETKPLLVHAIHVDEQDIDVIARSDATVAHCPVSNAKLGQGIAPLTAILRAGIPVGLGSDSVASNNRMDLLTEARQALLFSAMRADTPGRSGASVSSEGAHVRGSVPANLTGGIDASDALHLATAGGARALGLDGDIGTLDVGKAADIAVFDHDELLFGPAYDPAASLVHTLAGRARARCVLVDGDILVAEGQVVREEPALADALRSMTARLWEWRANQAGGSASGR